MTAQPAIVLPRTLNLQAIDVCNSRCVMCNVWKAGRREQMGTAELRAYLQRPFFSEVGHVGVTGGEPTLRKDLFELYRLFPEVLPKLKGASFITHGMQTARTVEVYAQVCDHYRALSLSFEGMVSLDGVGAVHDRVRGRKGAFAAATETLFTLRRRGVPTIAACTIVRSNVFELHDLLDWGKAQDIYIRFRVAEFIRRLYNDDCAAEIRSFTAPERRHLVSFFHVLLTEYEKNDAIRKTYQSILSLLTGGERLIGCPYRNGVAVNVDSRGQLACCAPKGTAFEFGDDAAAHARLERQRADIATNHCARCIHDYHDDWHEAAMHEAIQAHQRGRELYEVADDMLTAAEGPAEAFDVSHLKRVLLAGWYGTETAGDIAILQGIMAEYLERNPLLEFDVLSLFPYYTRSTVEAWPQALRAKVRVMDYASEAAWRAIVADDALVMAGGPLMDIGETRKILCLFKRFTDLGKPRVIEGCGIGPLNQAEYRWNVCRIARLATRISVRDQASRQMLRTFGIRKPIEVRLDPAVTFVRAQQVRHHGGEGKVIRCFLRELTHEYPQAVSPEQAVTGLATLLRRLLEWHPEHQIELWAMHHFPVGYDDRLVARKLVRDVNSPRLTCEWEPRTPREILEAMAAAEFCVCMRFHSCVFATEVGVPFLAIDYTAGGKIKGFLDDVHQEGRLVSLAQAGELTLAQLRAKLTGVVGATDEVAEVEASSRLPRVLHVIQSVTGGGGARAMISLAKHSRRLGGPEHRVVSLLPAEPTGLELARAANIDLINHPDEKALRRELAVADIVLVHWWNVPELAAMFHGELPPMRLALWLHVGGYHSPQVLTRRLLEFADLTVACSPHTYAHPVFADLPEAIRAERTAMVLAGADFDRLAGIGRLPHAEFRIGYIGTVDPVKMHGDFVTMSCAVRVPDAKFVVCGGGDVRWLADGAARLGRRDSFEFLGAVDDIRSVIETLDVYGYPLCADTYAAAELNLQEVMYAGVPVVAFAYGGIGRLIRHNETGLLVSSVEEYVRAIEHLHANSSERARLGANAAAFARAHWGAENAARAFNLQFERLLAWPKRDRAWPEAASAADGGPDLPRDMAIHPGVRRFLESLADGARPFVESMRARSLEEALVADDRIAKLPRLMQFTGVQAYRNAHGSDPFLQFWTGLALMHAGEPLSALGCFELALRAGFPDLRIHWHRALAAERAGRSADAVAILAQLLAVAPNFGPAIELSRRLGGTNSLSHRPTGTAVAAGSMQQLLQRAAQFLRTGEPAKARAPLARALELLPGHVGVMEALAELEARLGHLDSARTLRDAILLRAPGRQSPALRAVQAALEAAAKRLQPT